MSHILRDFRAIYSELSNFSGIKEKAHIWSSLLHITTAVREGEVSSGLLTEDTGSITRLNLATNEGADAVTVGFPLVGTDNAES